MLRRLKLRTKLRLLMATALGAALALAVPSLLPSINAWRRAERAPSVARASAALTNLLREVEQEATQSAWYLASGNGRARDALRAARPLTDRAAGVLIRDRAAVVADGHTGAAQRITDVLRAWTIVKQARTPIDRRTLGDLAALRAFDAVERSITRALDGTADAAPGGLAADLRAKARATRLELNAAQEQATLVIGIERSELTPPLAERLVLGATDQRVNRPAALEVAKRRSATLGLVTVELGAAADAVAKLRAPALAQGLSLISTAEWLRASDRQLSALRTLTSTLDTAAANRVAVVRDGARDELVRAALLLAGVLLLVLILGLVLIRAITRPIHDVLRATTALARRQQNPPTELNDATDEVRPVAVRTRDPIGDIARAVHDIDLATAAGVEAQRQTLRHDIGDVYVNLARRNQPLLHRQLEIIDTLEATERDPDRLSSLFLLDHLATRLRRNAESLLVLAGVDDQRTHAQSAPLLDVVRGAASAIGDYARIDIVGLPSDVDVVGRFAVDLTHVLAELLENATNYSSPETRIFVGARRRPNGIELTIADEGIGIPVDRLDALNELLAHPPLPGFDLSRSLGLVVVARLCERIGVEVQLRSAAEVGTSAVIIVPLAIMRSPDHDPALIGDGDSWTGSERTVVADPADTGADALPEPVTAPVALALPIPLEPVAPQPVAPQPVAPQPVALQPVAPPEPSERFSPVPFDGGFDLLPSNGLNPRHARHRPGRATTAGEPVVPGAPAADPVQPLPRRTPVPPEERLIMTPTAPAARAPDAAFELVARYQAGRRRAVDNDHEHGPHQDAPGPQEKDLR